jgi:ribose transport system permease protein
MLATEPSLQGGWARRSMRGDTARELGVLIPLILFVGAFFAYDSAFLSRANVTIMLVSASYSGIVAVGMTYLMLAREIDLSVGSVVGLSSMIWAWLLVEGQVPLWQATLLTLVAASAVGMFNAFATVKLRVPAIIATLAMFFVARGLVFVISDGNSISPLPDSIAQVGSIRIMGLPLIVLTFLALVVFGEGVLRLTTVGRRIKATGGNERAARVVGIKTHRVKTACFVLTALASAVAGMFFVTQVRAGDPGLGVGLELDVIAGVVIGGISLLGGVGRVVGAALGVCLMQVVRSGMIFAGINSN